MPSSAIQFYKYNAEKHSLLVVFTSGRRYIYANVPPAVVKGLDDAESKGTFFNAEIRDRYDYDEITR